MYCRSTIPFWCVHSRQMNMKLMCFMCVVPWLDRIDTQHEFKCSASDMMNNTVWGRNDETDEKEMKAWLTSETHTHILHINCVPNIDFVFVFILITYSIFYSNKKMFPFFQFIFYLLPSWARSYESAKKWNSYINQIFKELALNQM